MATPGGCGMGPKRCETSAGPVMAPSPWRFASDPENDPFRLAHDHRRPAACGLDGGQYRSSGRPGALGRRKDGIPTGRVKVGSVAVVDAQEPHAIATAAASRARKRAPPWVDLGQPFQRGRLALCYSSRGSVDQTRQGEASKITRMEEILLAVSLKCSAVRWVPAGVAVCMS